MVVEASVDAVSTSLLLTGSGSTLLPAEMREGLWVVASEEMTKTFRLFSVLAVVSGLPLEMAELTISVIIN